MKKCYIYAIKNISNNKRYIGSTINILRRFREHFQKLKDNIHYNAHLQRAYNKYGKELFISEILEEFEFETEIQRTKKEQYYINFYNSYKRGYNAVAIVNNNFKRMLEDEALENMKLKVSIANKGKTPKNCEEMRKKTWKAVYELRDGIIVNEYPSVKAAGDALNIDYKSIHAYLKNKESREKNNRGKKRLRTVNLKNRKNPNLDWKYKN